MPTSLVIMVPKGKTLNIVYREINIALKSSHILLCERYNAAFPKAKSHCLSSLNNPSALHAARNVGYSVLFTVFKIEYDVEPLLGKEEDEDDNIQHCMGGLYKHYPKLNLS